MSDCFDHYMDAMEDIISGRTYDEGPDYDAQFLSKGEWIRTNLTKVKRICIKCDHQFKSRVAKACPECGGWTQIK